MKILPLVTDIKRDIAASGTRIKRASRDGYSIANRSAKVYGHGVLKRYFDITRSISNKIISGTTKQEIPYLAGAIGMMVPLPLTTPLFFGLGLLVRFSLPASALNGEYDYEDETPSHFNEIG